MMRWDHSTSERDLTILQEVSTSERESIILTEDLTLEKILIMTIEESTSKRESMIVVVWTLVLELDQGIIIFLILRKQKTELVDPEMDLRGDQNGTQQLRKIIRDQKANKHSNQK